MELYPVESFERSRDTGDLLDLSEAVWPLRVMLFESFDPIVSLFQGPKWTQEVRGGASCKTRTAAKRARGADSAAIRVCFFLWVAHLLWFFKGKMSFIQSGWERNMYWLLYLSFTVTRLVMQPLSSWLRGWFLPGGTLCLEVSPECTRSCAVLGQSWNWTVKSWRSSGRSLRQRRHG